MIASARRLVAGLVIGVLIVGCASSASTTRTGADPGVSATELRDYVAQVEKVRLPVNSLLDGADPILEGFHDKTITPDVAADQMDALEQRFAGYLLDANAISPSNKVLAKMNTPYARTYFYEDAYLATLASDLREGDFDNLPNTQDAQRLAIIEWRTQLDVAGPRHARDAARRHPAGRSG